MSDAREAGPAPPPSLVRLQRDFGAAVATPFAFLDERNAWRARLEDFAPGVVRLVRPRGDAGPAQRLAVYNRQYWFRLFTTMQEELPLLRHVLGLARLNRLASDYLTRHPSRCGDLRHLTRELGDFLAASEAWGRPPWRACAALDRIHAVAFDAAHEAPLDPAALDDEARAALAERPLRLQPHWHLFEERWNLVELRARALELADDAPPLVPEELDAPAYWAIWRHGERVTATRLDPLQATLLGVLADGVPFAAACERAGEEAGPERLAYLREHIGGWFATWASRGWFARG